MIISPHPQGTDEWLIERLGKPSASMFSKLITSTGKPSTSSDAYINQLIAERYTGQSTPVHVTEWMVHGNDFEPIARANYEFITDEKVSEYGFIFDDSREFGCSPDGLVGKDGGLEIKCPAPTTQIAYFRNQEIGVKKYYAQIQGCMMVTNKKWWDFFSFHPNLPHVLVRVNRDEQFIEKLSKQVLLAVQTIKTSLINLEKVA
ncbi:putative phage-type endonuclease (TIGR03033) [uncultured Mediterranean phage uvMED]|nr:putative phage-type endonuclease (TIGR03033) [uncultured Mediterranean phage uvMED]